MPTRSVPVGDSSALTAGEISVAMTQDASTNRWRRPATRRSPYGICTWWRGLGHLSIAALPVRLYSERQWARRPGKERRMSKVRVLVGTRKGAFVLTSDGKRAHWDVSGPHFGGWEIYHLKGSPADPDRLYASQSTGWFGQLIQRSSDGGKTWEAVGNKFAYEGEVGTHLWYDGTPRPWESKP